MENPDYHISQGMHLSLIYRTREEQLSASLPYLSSGLKQGEKCYYICNEDSKKEILHLLSETGESTLSLMKNNQLVFLNSHSLYENLVSQKDPLNTAILELEKEALARGFQGLRILSEVPSLIQHENFQHQSVINESRINRIFHNRKISLLCQYHEKEFFPDFLIDILHTHPYLILYREFFKNPFYVPPREYLKMLHNQKAGWETYFRKLETIRKIKTVSRTEEKQAPLCLADRESPMLVSVHLNGAVKTVNESAARLFGQPEREIKEKNWFSFTESQVSPEKLYHSSEADFDWIKGALNAPALSRNIRWKPVLLNREAGEMVLEIRPENFHSRWQELIRESELKFKHIFEQSFDGMSLMDREGTVIHWNNAMEEITGVSFEEALGRPIWEIQFQLAPSKKKTPEYREELKSFVLNIFQNHWPSSSRTEEAVISNAQGIEKTIQAVSFPIHLEETFLVGSIVRDITEKRKNEVLIQQSEKLYRSLIQTSPNAIVLLDLNGRIIFASDQTLKLSGYERAEELMGLDGFQFVTDSNRANKDLMRLLSEENIQNAEYTFFRKDGSTFIAEGNACLIRNESGTPKMIMFTFRDITRQKEWENELQASIEEKETLLKEIHHRVKNNLQIVTGLLMLQEHYQSTPKMHQILKESVARVHSMALIHEKLYQSPKFSQIQSSEYFENLIRDLSASYQINPQKIRIRTQLENIPLKIDTAIPLGLILTELLTNAFKYAFKGKKPGNIYLEMGRNKDEICLLVEDNGKGLPEKFNPENAQTLGLNLVRSLTTQLNGTVDFQSHAGLKVLIRFPYLFSAED